MKIDTRDFGPLEIDADQIIEFCSPIYGFERLSRFVLLYDDSVPGPFCRLQSLDEAEVCFVLVEPTAIIPEYAPAFSQDVRKLLALEPDETPVLRVMTVIPKDYAESTMNLKSPILINPAKKCAAQIILEEDYPLRANLVEASSC